MTYNVFGGTSNLALSICIVCDHAVSVSVRPGLYVRHSLSEQVLPLTDAEVE